MLYYRREPGKHMLQRARSRAQKKGLAFDLTIEDITPLPTYCPVFGVELCISNGGQSPNAYSLDRIDNTRGYVPGNVVVMSYLANRLKNDGTAEQHEQIARWMRRM